MNIDFNNIGGNFCSINSSSKNLKHTGDNMNFNELLENVLDYTNDRNTNSNFDIHTSKDVDCRNLVFENKTEDADNETKEFANKYDCDECYENKKSYLENYDEETVDDENFKNLKSLVYILDTIYLNHPNDRSIFDFSKIENLEKFCDSNKIDENNLSKILCSVGCDEVSVHNKSISNEEVLKQIFNDTENFKMLLRNEIIKFEEKEFDNSILKILDSGDFLYDKDLLKNLKSEIASRLNESIFVSDKDNMSEYTLNKFISPKNLDSKFSGDFVDHSKDSNVLKEIYGDTDLSKSIDNYYVDLVRNNELSNVTFEKVIDGSNPQRFQKELIDAVEYMSAKGKSEMSIKITPDHLGKIDIKYEVTKNNVRVIIRAEKNETMKLIDNTVAQIKNMVRENHQIDLKNVYVDVGQFEFGSSNKGSSKQDDNKSKNSKRNNIEIESDLILGSGNDLRSGVLV